MDSKPRQIKKERGYVPFLVLRLSCYLLSSHLQMQWQITPATIETKMDSSTSTAVTSFRWLEVRQPVILYHGYIFLQILIRYLFKNC